ncbi:MAG: lamin tail domain-containing protein, partial [Saprospiraceae bacterium]
TSDFTSLPAGCYTVHGVSYENILTPSSWIGNTLSATLSSGDCLLPSNNTKPVKVTSTCPISAGDLIITEIMYDPSGTEATDEWFEIYNTTGANIDINGFIICDNNSSHTIGSSVIVPSMAYAVLAKSAGAAPSVDYVYSTLVLANGGDEVNIKCPDGTLIDRVDYTGFGLGADGASIQLDPSRVGAGGGTDNDSGSNWFTSTSDTPFAPNNDFGTPGGVNNLPIELLSFNGKANHNTVDLLWTTLTEENNAGFEVQRSRDSENWEKIGFVRGAGNSAVEINYDFVDKNPNHGENYYRLKQIDFDQAFSITKVIRISFGKKEISINISPNPNNGSFQYSINGLTNNPAFELTVFDSFGRMVSQQNHSEIQGNMDLKHLANGIYIFSIQIGTDIYVERIMIH